MVFIAILLVVVVLSGLLFAMQKKSVTAPGRELFQRFVALNPIKGKTKDEIIAQVGPPTSISALAGGQSLLQWQATGCHMALVFTGDTCEGISHQYVHQD